MHASNLESPRRDATFLTITLTLRNLAALAAMPELHHQLSLWSTDRCSFYFLDADVLRRDVESFPRLLRLQDILASHPESVAKREISLKCACSGEYTGEYLAISHRWETRDDPDPSSRQLREIRQHLLEHPRIRFVWIDFCSLWQGDDRTPSQKDEFKLMLPNVNLLYLGASVLILADRSYLGRFWTLFESWLASSVATADRGLVTADRDKRRAQIRSVEDPPAPEGAPLAARLEAMWADCSASVAHAKLSAPGISVTNGSDRAVQLPKIYQLDADVRRVLASAL